jgi:hypothetical protein
MTPALPRRPEIAQQAQLFDHLVGATEQRQRHGDAKRLCRFEVDQ